jgi:hypothetical protein
MKRFSATRVRSTENTPLGLLVALLVVLLLAPAAHAQINSPPPPLMGQKSYHLYSVPYARIGSGSCPFFLCTNITDAAIQVGVEGFFYPGGGAINDASATSYSVPAGGTALFGRSAAGLSINSDTGFGSESKGSARILATKRTGIICTAFVADRLNDPPATTLQLTIVRKKTQKGD